MMQVDCNGIPVTFGAVPMVSTGAGRRRVKKRQNLRLARKWTADEEATLRRMAGAGYSDGEIARHLCRQREVVCRHRIALGIRPGFRPALGLLMARINARRMAWAA